MFQLTPKRMKKMASRKVQYNDKILDAMSVALKCRVLALEGTARSSKTMLIGDVFYYAVKMSEEKYHIIAGRDLDAIRINILDADVVGLRVLHPDCKMKKSQIGGWYLSIIGFDGKEKQVSLVNYSNESSWKKVLGGTKGIILIDEVNIANKNFVDECFARQTSARLPRTYFTLNGDDPAHWCYQDFINYCQMIGNVPASIVKEMTDFQKVNGTKPYWYYMHFTMWDNPVMTPAKIEEAKGIFKVGSYYYITKILGERGKMGTLLFADCMSEDLIVDAFEKDQYGMPKYRFESYTFGVDIGANKAFNVIHFTGFTKGYKQAICLFKKKIKIAGYNNKKPIIFEFVDMCLKVCKPKGYQLDGFLIDSAEQNFIQDLKAEMWDRFGLEVIGSYKATVKERQDMMNIGFATKRILFNSACKETYHSYLTAEVDEKTKLRLDNDVTNANGEIDDQDSFEYSLTRHMKDLMYLGGDF